MKRLGMALLLAATILGCAAKYSRVGMTIIVPSKVSGLVRIIEDPKVFDPLSIDRGITIKIDEKGIGRVRHYSILLDFRNAKPFRTRKVVWDNGTEIPYETLVGPSDIAVRDIGGGGPKEYRFFIGTAEEHRKLEDAIKSNPSSRATQAAR